jgi:hypothetical protein
MLKIRWRNLFGALILLFFSIPLLWNSGYLLYSLHHDITHRGGGASLFLFCILPLTLLPSLKGWDFYKKLTGPSKPEGMRV